jgi:sulfate adenylyltransferase
MQLRDQSAGWPSWTVAGRQLADLESLIAGLLSPSTGYASRSEHNEGASGPPLPSPVLEVTSAVAAALKPGSTLALRDPEGVLLAALHAADVWNENGVWRVSGTVEGVSLPAHHDFLQLRLTPSDVAAKARALGRSRLIAFYPGQVLHAGVREALIRLASEQDACILLLLSVDSAARDDLSFFAGVRALEVSAGRLPADRTIVVLVPAAFPADAMTEAAVLRALVARNYGASTLAVDVSTAPAVHDTVAAAAHLVGVRLLSLRPWGFDPEQRVLSDKAQGGSFEPAPSEQQILSWVAASQSVPRWLMATDEVEALQRLCGPDRRRGFTVFFTGLSGSGKSTIAGALRYRLMEMTGRPVTLLDGDEVRSHLSSELGFSREHRDLNIRRIGWVAAEITRHGGMAVCAPIAPYDAVRKRVRAMVEAAGGFVLVHVATPLEVCERRDRKGLYARARAGAIPQFTGVSDPYEVPGDAALSIDTTMIDVDAACQAVIEWLQTAGYLAQ